MTKPGWIKGKQTDGKGLLRSAALSTAHAQFRIKSELAQLARRTADPDDPDEPLAKRVKRRNDRVKMEPDDDFLDPEYILSDHLKPGMGFYVGFLKTNVRLYCFEGKDITRMEAYSSSLISP